MICIPDFVLHLNYILMMKFLKRLEWIFDFYIAWMLYNARKSYNYHKYMINKWGDKYKKRTGL